MDWTREHARLFLLSALYGAEIDGRGSRLSLSEWESVLSMLTPREIVVVALTAIRGLDPGRAGAVMGYEERPAAHVYEAWKQVAAKLREDGATLSVLRQAVGAL